MQRELFNMFGSRLYSYTGPLRGGHDADVAHGENEFDAPALNQVKPAAVWGRGAYKQTWIVHHGG